MLFALFPKRTIKKNPQSWELSEQKTQVAQLWYQPALWSVYDFDKPLLAVRWAVFAEATIPQSLTSQWRYRPCRTQSLHDGMGVSVYTSMCGSEQERERGAETLKLGHIGSLTHFPLL